MKKTKKEIPLRAFACGEPGRGYGAGEKLAAALATAAGNTIKPIIRACIRVKVVLFCFAALRAFLFSDQTRHDTVGYYISR